MLLFSSFGNFGDPRVRSGGGFRVIQKIGIKISMKKRVKKHARGPGGPHPWGVTYLTKERVLRPHHQSGIDKHSDENSTTLCRPAVQGREGC